MFRLIINPKYKSGKKKNKEMMNSDYTMRFTDSLWSILDSPPPDDKGRVALCSKLQSAVTTGLATAIGQHQQLVDRICKKVGNEDVDKQAFVFATPHFEYKMPSAGTEYMTVKVISDVLEYRYNMDTLNEMLEMYCEPEDYTDSLYLTAIGLSVPGVYATPENLSVLAIIHDVILVNRIAEIINSSDFKKVISVPDEGEYQVMPGFDSTLDDIEYDIRFYPSDEFKNMADFK
jgi:hypothetical protein